MRIALVMLDQNYGGMQQAFLNYSIELSKRGFPVLPVIRNESVVENIYGPLPFARLDYTLRHI